MMKGEYTVDDSCFWCPNNPCKVTCSGINCTNSEMNGTAQAMREGRLKATNKTSTKTNINEELGIPTKKSVGLFGLFRKNEKFSK